MTPEYKLHYLLQDLRTVRVVVKGRTRYEKLEAYSTQQRKWQTVATCRKGGALPTRAWIEAMLTADEPVAAAVVA